MNQRNKTLFQRAIASLVISFILLSNFTLVLTRAEELAQDPSSVLFGAEETLSEEGIPPSEGEPSVEEDATNTEGEAEIEDAVSSSPEGSQEGENVVSEISSETPSVNAPEELTSGNAEVGEGDNLLAADFQEGDFIIEDDWIKGFSDSGKTKILANKDVTISGFGQATKISSNAFSGLDLNSVVIGGGITSVGSHAFQNSNLTSITLKSGVVNIEEYAFADNKIAEFTDESEIETIGDFAFYSNELTQVQTSAITLGTSAFASNRLQEARLKRATDVGNQAFTNNIDLKKLTVETLDPPQELLKEDSFDQGEEPVEVDIARNANAIASLDISRYVVNPVSVIITIKDKTNDGPLINKITKKHELIHLEDEYPVPIVEGYTYLGTGTTIPIDKNSIQDNKIEIELLYMRTSSPHISVSESKQVVFTTTTSLSKTQILKDITFYDSQGQVIRPVFLSGENQDPRITLSRNTIPAPRVEKTEEVEITLTDHNGEKDSVILQFQFTAIDKGEEEIIPGLDWKYKDFRYSSDRILGFSDTGLEKLRDNKNVVLPDINPTTAVPITAINNSAFKDQKMDTVNFEKMEQLKSIDHYAFQNSGLVDVLNEENLVNLTYIGVDSFRNNNLREFGFDKLKKLEVIGDRSFLDNKLEGVLLTDLPELRIIGSSSFENNAIKTLKIEATPKLETISSYSFKKNVIDELVLNDLPKLKMIGYESFIENKIKTVEFRDLPLLEQISDRTFMSNEVGTLGLSNVPSLKIIGNNAFYRNKIRELDLSEARGLVRLGGFEGNQIESLNLEGLTNLQSIESYAFKSNKLKEVKLSELTSLQRIGYQAFYDNPELRSLKVQGARSLESLSEHVFGQTALEELELRDLPGLKNLNGFQGIRSLKKLTVESLPLLETMQGFSGTGLVDVTLKDLPRLVRIAHSAFYQAPIENLVMEGLPLLSVIDGHAFDGSKLQGELDLTPFPELTKIGTRAFGGAKLTSLKLDGLDKLKTIEGGAFTSNQLEKVVIKGLDSLETIGAGAFEQQGGWKSLTDVIIEDNPKLKTLGGFQYNYNLSKPSLKNLPELAVILDSAFYNTKIKEMDLSGFPKLKHIGRSSFSGGGINGERNVIADLLLPDSVEVIDDNSYRNNRITSVDLRHLTGLKKIGSEAFAENTAVFKEFKLPVTADPIELGRLIGSPKTEDLDFSTTPGVKVKLTSAKPFLSSGPLVMKFKNASQLTLGSNMRDLDPNNPTVVFIEHMDVPITAPPGILINPGKTVIDYEDESGNKIPGTSPTTRYMPQGEKVVAPDFEGYRATSIKVEPQGIASFDPSTRTATIGAVPSGSTSKLTFVYGTIAAINDPEYKVSIKRTGYTQERFTPHGTALNVEALFNLKNIPANEKNSKVVIQLPQHATKNKSLVTFPPTIPNVELSAPAYYDPERKQVIYPIKEIKDTSILMNIRVKFEYDGLDTPMDNEDYAKAYYVIEDGRRKGELASSEKFVTYYRTPGFHKEALHGEPATVTGSPNENSNNGHTDVSMTYWFRFHDLGRRADRIVMKDTLPTYRKWDEATGREVVEAAKFDPAKNQGWVYDPANNTVSYELDKEFLDALVTPDGRRYTDWHIIGGRFPKLVLDFPKAVAQTGIINRVDTEIHIHNPSGNDVPVYRLNSTSNRSIAIGAITEGVLVSKTGYEHYFIPYSSDTHIELPWTIRIRPSRVLSQNENGSFYHVPRIKNIEVWDFDLDRGQREENRLFDFTSVRANHPMKIFLYNSREPSPLNHVRPQYTADKLVGEISLAANEKYTLTAEQLRTVKNIKFSFENVTLSSLDEEIVIDIGSKLKEGKQIPNNYSNRENLAQIFADVDVQEVGVSDKPFKTYVSASKYIRPTKKYIEVTKSSNLSNNQTVTNPTQEVDYTLGFRAGYTISQINEPFYIKNFKLVDLFPGDLDLKRVTLNPEFENVGGTYRTELVNGASKLIFSAPYVPSNLAWVAKVNSSIKYGAPGDGTVVNKAYIDFEETETEASKQIEHKNAAPIAEEGNKRLTTSSHSFKLLFNDSLVGRKYIRKSSVDGAWMDEIQTLPGETFEYKFEVSNNLALDVNKMEFFDLFPYDRDRLLLAGLTGNHPLRGSQFANTLVRVKSIRMTNLKTGQSDDVQANFPITYFKSRDGYPANLFGGTAKQWLEGAKNNPALQTNDPNEAIGLHIGGGGASTLSKYSRLEIVLEMKAPDYDLAHIEQWEGKKANNTFAMNYEGLSKYTEVPPVTNEMITPKKDLTFKKVDKLTGQSLSGAKYRLEQDGLVKDAVSDPEGLLRFKNVNYKPYEIREVEPPAGYKLDTQTYRKVLDYNDYVSDLEKIRNGQPVDEVVQTFEDEKLPPVDNTKYTLRIHKKNRDTSLGNVKFKLENLSTREVLEGTTDLSGVFEFKNLKNGQYRLAELSNLNRFTLIEPFTFELPLPDGFQSSSVESTSKEVDTENPDHKIYTFVIQNRTYNIEMVKLGVRDLVRTKKDTQRRTTEGELLPNVNFELFDTGKTMTATGVVDSGAGDTSRGNYTTNARGRIAVGGLVPNTVYKFVEVQAPESYEKAEPIEFYVDDSGMVRSMEKEGYFRPEMLLITNYRQVLKSSMLIEKIDPDTQEKLPDATFKLYKNIGGQYRELEDENTVNKKYTQMTNEQGKLSFEDLTYGRYRVEEILPPNGYLKGVEPIEFTVDPYLSRTISKTVKNRKMDFSVVKVEELGGPYQTDALARQALEQMKQNRQDDEDLIVAQRHIYKKLKGARLELKENYRDNNDVVVPLSTQDVDGYSVYRYSEGLSQYGAYTLSELTAPVGYVKAPAQTIKLDRLINYNNPKATFYLKNVRQKGQIHITKFEGRGNNVLPGAEFSIYDGHLTKEEAHNATPIRRSVTDANGIVQFTNLELGDYTIVETNAPVNYKRIEEVSHVSLTPNSTVARKSFYNKLDTTTVFLKKVDDNARPIADLTNSNFEFYYDGKLHSVGVPTGEEGMIKFENVPLIGEYKIRETGAPTGYVISGRGEQSFQATNVQPLNIDPRQNQVRIMQNKEQIEIRASKLWIGGNPARRPQVYFKLFRTYEGGTSEEVQVPVAQIGREDTQVEFGFFDKYKHLPDGTVKEYVYYVKETDEHGVQLNMQDFFYESNTAQNTLDVTNTYHSPKTSLKVTKEWELGEQAARPDLKFILFRKTAVAPQLQQVVGQEKLVPKSAGIVGTVLNREISVEFTDLALTDQNGEPYTYVVKEVKADSSAIDETVNFVPENSFEREAIKRAGDTFLSASFKNIYRSPKRRVEATKEWVNGPDVRPQTWFKLYRNIAGEEPQEVLTAPVRQVDNLTNTVSWEAMDETDEHGNPYIYSVKEVNSTGTDLTFVPENYRKEEQGSKVINTYVIPKTQKTVEKVWALSDGEAKPAQIEVVLKRELNGVIEDGYAQRATLNEADGWRHTFVDLDKTDVNGQTYTYVLVEQNHAAYDATVQNKADGSGFVVTNTQRVFHKTVHKQWNNTTGEADPTSIRVHLIRNDRTDVPYRSVELSATNQWQHEFRDLPSHDSQGQAYVYTVEEDEVAGYTPVIDPSTFKIINTRKVKSIEVTKTWVDEAGSLDKPEEITIHLYKDKQMNPNPYKTARIRAGADPNVWKYEFVNLPEFDLAGRAYEYTVEEVPVPGYQSVVDRYSVTNTRELTRVPVTKVWIQTEGGYPQNVTYRLYRDGQEIGSKTVGEDSWNTVFDMDDSGLKLPKKNPQTGADYSYTVAEDAVVGYTTSVQGNQITNTQNTRTIKLKKNWDRGPKPDVVLELKRRVGADTDPNFVRRFTATSTVLESEEYTVPTHNPAGRGYDYYVEEPNVPHGYTETIGGFEVTNTYRSPQIDLKVKKEWNLGEEVQKPDLKFILYRKTQNDTDFVQVPGEEKDVPKGGLISGILNRDLIAEFTGLPVTDEDGNDYIYKVKEVKADGSEIDEDIVFKPETSDERTAEQKQGETFLSAEFVNIYESPSIRVEAEKEWVDGPDTRPNTWFKLYRNVRGEQPQSVAHAQVKEVDPLTGRVSWDDLEETDEHGKAYIYSVKEVDASGTDENFTPENYRKEESGLKVINTYVIPKTEKTVEKVWELARGEKPPTEVEVVLKRSLNAVEDNGFEERMILNEDNGWKGSFSNLDKTDIHGIDYIYKIQEQHFDAYESEISEKADASGFVITNRQKTTSKTAKKAWVNTTGEPDPTSVTVYLLRDDKADQPYRTANLGESTQWQYEFTDLPTHDENGREYVYSLKEAEVKGYTSAVDQTAFVLTNTRQVKSIEVEKNWVDESNQVEKPDEITLYLYKDKHKNPNPYKVAKLRAGADLNVWKYEFAELPEFDLDGRSFEYTVEEVPVPGYQSVVDRYSVTNTRELVKIPVTKTWEQVEEIYPQSVTYRLYQDGQEIAVKTADRSNWNVVFETDDNGFKLPKKNIHTGRDYTYTLSEDPVTGYTATVDGYQITNKQETVSIRLNKVWIDGPKSGATLLLKRKAAGQEDRDFVREFRASATLLQSEEFKLPVYNEDGEEYEYFADEQVPENYTATIDGFEVTNTYHSPKIEVTGVNIFVGGPSQKPRTWLKLYRRIVIIDEHGNKQTVVDEEVPSDSLKDIPSSTESEVHITWSDLDKTNSSGIDYEYYVKEVDGSGNDATPPSYSKNENGLTVVNNYLKYEKDVYVKKQWNQIQAGDAPEVKVFLVKNGQRTRDFIQISKDTNWEGVFRNVVIKEITNGSEVQNDYTLFEEGDPNGLNNGRIVVIGRNVFEVEVTGDVDQGFVITNTRLNETPPNSGGGTPPSVPDEDRPQAPWTSTPPEPTDPPTDHQGSFVEEGSSDPSSSLPKLPQVPKEGNVEPEPKDLNEELKKNPVIKTKLKKVRKKIPKTGQIYNLDFFLKLMPLTGAVFILMGIAGKRREQ